MALSGPRGNLGAGLVRLRRTRHHLSSSLVSFIGSLVHLSVSFITLCSCSRQLGFDLRNVTNVLIATLHDLDTLKQLVEEFV